MGAAAAQQFLAFLRFKDEIPDPEEILSGKKVKTPMQPDAQYLILAGLINALINDLSDERIENYFKFINLYKQSEFSDYCVILVKELLLALQAESDNDESKKSMVTNHTSYKQWVAENISVFS